jgi:hypothetical protein
LATVFLIVGVLATGEIAAAMRQLLDGPRLARVPFTVIEASRMFGVGRPHYRCQLAAIDGKPFTRGYQEIDINDAKRPGDRTTLTLKGPRGQAEEITLVAKSQAVLGSALASFVATSLFLPVFCFLPGFAVAAIRPRDLLAWLLLALLLSFGEAGHPSRWHWPARDLAAAMQGLPGDLWRSGCYCSASTSPTAWGLTTELRG